SPCSRTFGATPATSTERRTVRSEPGKVERSGILPAQSVEPSYGVAPVLAEAGGGGQRRRGHAPAVERGERVGVRRDVGAGAGRGNRDVILGRVELPASGVVLEEVVADLEYEPGLGAVAAQPQRARDVEDAQPQVVGRPGDPQ